MKVTIKFFWEEVMSEEEILMWPDEPLDEDINLEGLSSDTDAPSEHEEINTATDQTANLILVLQLFLNIQMVKPFLVRME